jgi:hypothetical protein
MQRSPFQRECPAIDAHVHHRALMVKTADHLLSGQGTIRYQSKEKTGGQGENVL